LWCFGFGCWLGLFCFDFEDTWLFASPILQHVRTANPKQLFGAKQSLEQPIKPSFLADADRGKRGQVN